MTSFPNYTLFLVLVVAMLFYASAKRRPFLFVFSSFSLVYLGLRPIMLDNGLYEVYAYLNNAFHAPGKEGLFYATLTQLLFLCFFIIGYFSTLKIRLRFPFEPYNIGLIKKSIISFILTFLIFSFYLLGLFPFYLVLVSTLFLFSYFTFLSFMEEKNIWMILNIASYLFLSILLLIFFSEDRRDYLAILYLVIFLYLFLFNRNRSLFVLGVFGFISLSLLIYISVAFRTEGLFDYAAVIERLSTSGKLILAVLEVETDFSIVYDDYVLLFSSLPNFDYLYGESFLKPLLSIIPREVYPGKIETTSRLFPLYFNNYYYSIGGSEPLTLYGDVFWNLSYIGVVFFFILGVFIKSLDNLYLISIIKNRAILGSFLLVLAATTFHIYRGPFDSFWFLHFYLLLVVFLYVLILQVLKK